MCYKSITMHIEYSYDIIGTVSTVVDDNRLLRINNHYFARNKWKQNPNTSFKSRYTQGKGAFLALNSTLESMKKLKWIPSACALP